uniref:Uncharacterized protein n=1 Tax=Globodera pallida TaxID=36090 RepID=A0A183C783_GLOPA
MGSCFSIGSEGLPPIVLINGVATRQHHHLQQHHHHQCCHNCQPYYADHWRWSCGDGRGTGGGGRGTQNSYATASYYGRTRIKHL